MIIVVVGNHSAEAFRAAPAVDFRFVADWSEADDVVETMDAVVGRVTPQVLARPRQLRWVHCPSAGVDADPSWDLPNVIVTPTTATSRGTARRGEEIVLDNLRRFVSAVPLRNVVDKAAGY
jgi:phosphoglycerate dehydrogenase-like enzyme